MTRNTKSEGHEKESNLKVGLRPITPDNNRNGAGGAYSPTDSKEEKQKTLKSLKQE